MPVFGGLLRGLPMAVVNLARRIAEAAAFVAAFASCNGAWTPPPPRGGSFVPPEMVKPMPEPPPPRVCTAARASEDLRPRADLTATSAPLDSNGQTTVYTSDLWARFNSSCGRCHVSANMGGKQCSEANFTTCVDAVSLARIESDQPTGPEGYMPPFGDSDGKPFSTRVKDDPIVTLAKYLEAWLAQGSPADKFVIDGDGSSAPVARGDYTFTP